MQVRPCISNSPYRILDHYQHSTFNQHIIITIITSPRNHVTFLISLTITAKWLATALSTLNLHHIAIQHNRPMGFPSQSSSLPVYVSCLVLVLISVVSLLLQPSLYMQLK